MYSPNLNRAAASVRASLFLILTVLAASSASHAEVRLHLKGSPQKTNLTPIPIKVGELLQLGISTDVVVPGGAKFHWKIVQLNTPAGITLNGDSSVAIDAKKLGRYLGNKGNLILPAAESPEYPLRRHELIDQSGIVQFVDAAGQKALGDTDAVTNLDKAADIANNSTAGGASGSPPMSNIYIKGVQFGGRAVVLVQVEGTQDYDAVLVEVSQPAQLSYAPVPKTPKISIAEGGQFDLSATADSPNVDLNSLTWTTNRPDILGLWIDNPAGVTGKPDITDKITTNGKTVVHFAALEPGTATIMLKGDNSNSVKPPEPLIVTVTASAQSARLINLPPLLRPGQTFGAKVMLVDERGEKVPVATEPGLKLTTSDSNVVRVGPLDAQGNFVVSAIDPGNATVTLHKSDDTIFGTPVQVSVGTVGNYGLIDAHFTVMPDDEAKKVFGGPVAKNFYVVSLSVLNNVKDPDGLKDSAGRPMQKAILIYSNTIRAGVTLDKKYDPKSQSKTRGDKAEQAADEIWTPVTVSDDWQRFDGPVKEVDYGTLNPYTRRFEGRANQHVFIAGQNPDNLPPTPASETKKATENAALQMTQAGFKADALAGTYQKMQDARTELSRITAQLNEKADVAELQSNVDGAVRNLSKLETELKTAAEADKPKKLQDIAAAKAASTSATDLLKDRNSLIQSLKSLQASEAAKLKRYEQDHTQAIQALVTQARDAKQQADFAFNASQFDLKVSQHSADVVKQIDAKATNTPDYSPNKARSLKLILNRADAAFVAATQAKTAANDSQQQAQEALRLAQMLARHPLTNESADINTAISAVKIAEEYAQIAAKAAEMANSVMEKSYHIEVSIESLKMLVGERARIGMRIVDGTGATVLDPDTLPAPIEWYSEDAAVASVSPDGIVTARKAAPAAAKPKVASAAGGAERGGAAANAGGIDCGDDNDCGNGSEVDPNGPAKPSATAKGPATTNIHVSMGGLDIPIKVTVEENTNPLLYPYFPYNYQLLAMGIEPREQDSKRRRLFSLVDAMGSFATSLTTLRVLRGSSGEVINHVNSLLLPSLKKAFPDMSDLQRQNILNEAMKDTEVVAPGDSLSKKLFFPKKPFRGYLPNYLTRISGIDNSYITIDIATIDQRKTIPARSEGPILPSQPSAPTSTPALPPDN